MTYLLDIQHASEQPCPVSDEVLLQWVENAIKPHQASAELTLRLVNPEEMIHLNHTYRQHNKVTNVLAFPTSLPEGITLDVPFLGDIIICPTVLEQESMIQEKNINAHWAHIVTHGVLHLLGYDHITDPDTAIMQSIEISTLAILGYDNPYEI